ncbi:gliding motility-associated C-terminal domain-containing protein [Marivirga sericea]|uniref:Gliding motility-associated C-terminal domain-containing protein n=1 Tax=Marivirga sericea TaxID=1028 RepID=A0A1X7JNA8_9BACT|nr:FG-GAP-like repeat-containing protein [Marivirga sericea]SMG29128.1 gliding motility-associated C-terminal domain-containing protein [Marivirga sericea]
MKLLLKYLFLFYLIVAANQALAQDVVIESVTPKEGYSGQIVDIKGVGLTGADQVFFGSVEGEIINVSDQLIEATVPNGATYDNITILNSTTGLIYSSEHFMLSYGGEQGVEASNFSPQIDFSAESGLYDVSVSDLDGDGKNDIIGANSNSNSATILRNISTPNNLSFVETPLNLGTPSLNSTTGDLNGDGKPEVVFSEGDDGNRLIILVNFSTEGNLSFTRQFIPINSSSTKRVVIKDMDLDGKPDLVVSDQKSNRIYIVKNTSAAGTLSFSGDIIELIVENAQRTAGLDVEDLNGDGKPDIITNQFLTDGGGFFIASNQSSPGNFSFSSFNEFSTGGTLVNLKVGDLNQDNRPDIVATLFLSSSVAVFVNETTGTGEVPQFSSAQNLATDLRPWGLDFGDIDGDGNVDIIVANTGPDKTVNVLNNDGSGGLPFSKVSLPVEFINRNIKVADLDGDSKPDIVFSSVDDESNNIPASKISILRNKRCIVPVITPESPINACIGNPVRLEAQDLDGVTFEWKQDGTTVKSGADNFLELNDAAESGSYTVSLFSEEGNCIETSEAVEVSITSAAALPSADITSNAPVCTGGTLTLTSTDVGATTYEWRGPEDFSATGISIDVENFNSNTAGRFYLDVYSGSCVIETKSITVDVISSPNFSIDQAGEGTYCVGETASLTVTPADSDYTFQWFRGSEVISGATSQTFNPTDPGNYFVEITDQVNTFCPKIYSDTLAVAFLEEPQVDFTLPSTACISTPVAFANESVIADEATAQFSWDFGDGGTSSDQDPTHVYNTAGTYDVVLEISYDGFSSCASQSTKQIVVNGGLSVEITASAPSICEGDNVVLSVDGTFESYRWDTGETSPTITVDQGGTYSVTVADANGCEGITEISVQEFPLPDVTLTASSMAITQGDTVTISASGLSDFQWTADSTQLSFTEGEIEIALSATTTIRVEGQDENGCFGSAEIVIQVNEEGNIGDRLTPMRFFSPNNDAIAQFWEIDNIENFSQCGVEIYDQQGNKIYEAKPYNNDWEGTANGSPIPDGVYYYVIKCEGTGIAKSGSITLLR